MARSRKYELGVGLLLLGAMVVFALMAVQIGALGGLRDTVEIEARIPDATGLTSGAVVAVAGVEVGAVRALALDHDRARVVMAVDPSAGIRRDAIVRVRARSVLGEKYIEIVPQSRDAAPIEAGDELVAADDNFEIDEMVNLVGPLLEALDPEQLATAMDKLTEALEDDPERLARMLANLDTLLVRGAEAGEALPGLVEDGRRTMAVARSALHDVEQRAEEAQPVVARADAVLSELEARTPELLAEVDGAVGDARALIDETEGKLEVILDNFSGFDKWELRRLLREEGIVVRLRAREVAPTDNPTFKRKGQVK
ncbi:MAG: MCE family protein [Deltaproteobacteria bacterium]|nr:MAG: MCE family protein [Deltaproteobacteria bacterium]